MTKRGGMILAVAALVALTGCSASPSEPLAAETSAPVSASASPAAAQAVAEPSVNPNAQIEKQFVEFAETRASAHGIPDDPSAKKVVAGLHAFCEEGKPFKVSKSAVFNKNLAVSAERSYCSYLSD